MDLLSMRVPPALRVILPIAFYFSLLAIFLPRLTPRVFHAVESLLSRLAERKTLPVIPLFLVVIGVRLALLPRFPVPLPRLHDSYRSFLLLPTPPLRPPPNPP